MRSHRHSGGIDECENRRPLEDLETHLDTWGTAVSFRAPFSKTSMANTISAAKRARQTVVRTARNRRAKAAIKGGLKEIRTAIAAGRKDEAKALLSKVVSGLDKAAKSGRVHKNKVNRHKSKLAFQIAALK